MPANSLNCTKGNVRNIILTVSFSFVLVRPSTANAAGNVDTRILLSVEKLLEFCLSDLLRSFRGSSQ